MPVLVYIDNVGGKFPKSALEAVYYAGKVASSHNTETVALTIGEVDDEKVTALGKYGANKVIRVSDERLRDSDSQCYAKVLQAAVEKENADIIVLSHNLTSKSVAPRLSAALKAALITGVVDYPSSQDGEFRIKRSAFSGKGFAYVSLRAEKKIITIQSNSFSPEEGNGQATVEDFDVELSDEDVGVIVQEVTKETDKVPLTEATIVVSGGRGLKGPENWNLIEDLAEVLNAATACSRPVADTGWRPHAEHVGQTGLTIRPNLYMAVGISGAIQHLAGVNGSKNIVVINTDPEAPFFKAADYGIVGDAFEVVPKLTEAFKKYYEAS